MNLFDAHANLIRSLQNEHDEESHHHRHHLHQPLEMNLPHDAFSTPSLFDSGFSS
jgi:hypothetical protein